MKDSIPKSIFILNELFVENGFQLYVVGGAVRDSILGLVPKDFDLSTNAVPTDIIGMLHGKYTYDMHGKDYGVIVVYTDDSPLGLEIATFRSDDYDGKLCLTRNPKIKFSTIEEDSARRDLTINAMFYNINTSEIIDLYGGKNDIKNKICRFVGDTLLRIKEDPLRILRIIRFACRFNFGINNETIDVIKQCISNYMMDIIVRERIIVEIMNMFKNGTSKSYTRAMSMLIDFRIFNVLMPLYDLETRVVDSPFIEVHMANLLRRVNNEDLCKVLVYDVKFKSTLVKKILFLRRLQFFNPSEVYNINKKRVDLNISDSLLIDYIDTLNLDPSNIIHKLVNFKPSIDVNIIIKQGISGKDIGTELSRLEYEQFLNQ